MGATLREAWLWLLLAFILGLVVGYVFKKRAAHEHPTADITSARIGELEAQLAECKASAAAPAAVAAAAAAVAAAAAAASGVATSSSAVPASRAASAAGASATLVAPKAKKTSASKKDPAATKAPGATKAPTATKIPARKPVAKPVPLDLAAAKSTLGTTVKLDDLKLIEGIGPKIEGLFKADGIVTWRDLSRSNVERLQGILGAACPRYSIHNPGSWPKQAGLLADGKWADFKALNDKLKGGR